jgi:hypothetical protein
MFSVGATGSQPLFYQWLLNNNQISGARNSSLVLSNVQPANAGNYSVAVKNSIGVTDSTTVSLTLSNVTFLPFADEFGSAGSLGAATNGSGFGSNVGATVEPGEPGPPNLPFGSSVWLEWQPQQSGVASFNTIGSGFDTMLAVFTGSSLTSLTLVASDDDSAPFLCSALSFNAVGGTTYFIQVSGFSGAAGNIEFSWNEVVAVQPPVISPQPESQTVLPGTNVTLSVGVQGSGPFTYQWFLNNVALPGQTNASLTLSNVDATMVGYYTVQVTNPQTLQSTTSNPAHLMLAEAGPGFTGNQAFISGQDKFQNATALTPPDPNVAHDPAPCGGFTGAISDGNALATAQVGEPNHCGYSPCHSVWYSYVSPASGPITLRLYGNNFNAVLGVYTGPGDSFTTLVPVACSANHGTAGESVTYTTSAGTTNWIVVDGVNCASGNYSLAWTVAASPSLSVQPVSQTLSIGSPLTLATTANGAPPLGYQWRLNGNNLPGANSSSYALSSFQQTNAGGYTLVVTNSYGSVTSLTATAVMATGTPVTIGASVSPGTTAGYIVGTGSYSTGQNVILTAVPNSCYSFVNWMDSNGSIVSTSPSLAFVASVNRTLTANFAFNSYVISASASPAAGGSVAGGGTYNCGSSITLTATANFGYQFSGWTEGFVEVSTTPTYTFSASANRTLLANFSPIVTLLVSPTNAGTVTYSVVQTRVTISAQPNNGWKFTTWSDGFPLNPRNITATAGAVYTADFVPASISLSFATPAFNGSGFNLLLTGPVGTTYRIDVSPDLLNWRPLTTVTPTNSPAFLLDSSVGQVQRFYRAVWLSP